MGLWGGDSGIYRKASCDAVGGNPDIYWNAFFDAVLESEVQLENIFVNPRHGRRFGVDGNEFGIKLEQYIRAHPTSENLSKIVDFYNTQTDVLLFAKHLKKEFPDKVVGLLNASDPDVTLGYHVGKYVNNFPYVNTTEENYAAAGSSLLNFEPITGVLSDPDRIIQL